ncbi:MAG TPA: polyhydroxyalkanoate synthesis regulator DNA-binding domain-containing protein [Polyangia bacterium]|nr:polyhydroxyalkanoate synthesis regulator DNA-binding domain-containing protein [Polyangia bacterium]
MAETRVVKRYANRKLYDTQRSRYVTLDQIAEMIRSGEDVKIVDNNSKEDLTAITLAQIIFEEEKKASFLPLSALRNIIQTSGQSIQMFATQAGEKVRAVFRRDKEEGGGDGGETPVEGGEGQAQPAGTVREFLERSQQTFDEWQKRVDERIRHAVEAVSPLAGLEKEIRALAQRLGDIEKRLDEKE